MNGRHFDLLKGGIWVLLCTFTYRSTI